MPSKLPIYIVPFSIYNIYHLGYRIVHRRQSNLVLLRSILQLLQANLQPVAVIGSILGALWPIHQQTLDILELIRFSIRLLRTELTRATKFFEQLSITCVGGLFTSHTILYRFLFVTCVSSLFYIDLRAFSFQNLDIINQHCILTSLFAFQKNTSAHFL